MGRMERGFRVAKASWAVLREDTQLLILPLISAVAILVFAAAILLPAYPSINAASANRGFLYLLLAIVYFVSTFVATFTNASIVGAATDRLNGGEGSVSTGVRLAWSKIDKIVAWSALTATVGLVLRVVEQRAGIFGAIVGRIVGVAWSVVTFLVVPVLLFEPVGAIDGVKRSAHLFKERWGEQFVGNASISIALFLLALPAVLVCVAVATVSTVLAIGLAVVAFGILMAMGGALSGIFNAALYQYAVNGAVFPGFSEDDLRGAFRPRRTRR